VANLEGDVMRAVVQIFAKIVRDSVDQAGYNGMREMTGTIKPYIRLLQQAQLDKAKQ